MSDAPDAGVPSHVAELQEKVATNSLELTLVIETYPPYYCFDLSGQSAEIGPDGTLKVGGRQGSVYTAEEYPQLADLYEKIGKQIEQEAPGSDGVDL